LKYLLDTCALSELRKPDCDAGLAAFLRGVPDAALYISAVSIGEIAKGIALLPDGRRKGELEGWLSGLVDGYRDHILPLGLETAALWGELTAKAQKRGRTIPALDGLIAATCLEHDLAVVTRNAGDFAGTGARVESPWV